MEPIRNQIAKRYLESDTSQFSNSIQHSRVTGSDMDGNPDETQYNAGFRLNAILYQSQSGKAFLKVNQQNESTPMNFDDFLCFID